LPSEPARAPSPLEAALRELQQRVAALEARFPAGGPRDHADEHLFMVLVDLIAEVDPPTCTVAALQRNREGNSKLDEALTAADIADATELSAWLRMMVGVPVHGYMLVRGPRSNEGRIYRFVSIVTVATTS
jgi:hypothetical protein